MVHFSGCTILHPPGCISGCTIPELPILQFSLVIIPPGVLRQYTRYNR